MLHRGEKKTKIEKNVGILYIDLCICVLCNKYHVYEMKRMQFPLLWKCAVDVGIETKQQQQPGKKSGEIKPEK